jgi:L-lysine exporter family protein LysE/ArgO
MSDCTLAVFHGGLLAFGLILPLGPQNLFVFTSGASNPFRRAMVVAAAAALSDTLLITLGVLGVSAAALEAPGVKSGMLLFGVVFLVYLGWITWRKSQPHTTAAEANTASTTLRRQVAVAFARAF